MSNSFRELARATQHVRSGGTASVHAHVFTFEPNGDTSHTDDPTQIDGWTTYLRLDTPDDPVQPFDVVLETDHPDRAGAVARAALLAEAILGDAAAYEVY